MKFIQCYVGVFKAENYAQANSYYQSQFDALEQAKQQAKCKAIANAEDEGLGHDAGEGAQRAVAPAKQIVGQVESTHDIAYGSDNADAGDDVTIYDQG